jgi:hypothetical protein
VQQEITIMATKTGNLKKTAKKAPAKQASAKQAKHEPFKSKFDPEQKVVWTGKDNPFREGSGAHERVEIVRKASGATVADLQAKPGLRKSTLATCARLALVQVS